MDLEKEIDAENQYYGTEGVFHVHQKETNKEKRYTLCMYDTKMVHLDLYYIHVILNNHIVYTTNT